MSEGFADVGSDDGKSIADFTRSLLRRGGSIRRCAGDADAVARYVDDDYVSQGWWVPGAQPSVGDLLVGVAAGKGLIVDLCRVEGIVTSGGQSGWQVDWDPDTDVMFTPPVPMRSVLAAMTQPPAPSWTRLGGEQALDFLDALFRVRDVALTAHDEGAEQTRRCRIRSRALRRDALRVHGCVCGACGFDPVPAFGDVGLRALDCHHLAPISSSGATSSTVADVRILCARCHRLAHLWDPPGLEAIDALSAALDA